MFAAPNVCERASAKEARKWRSMVCVQIEPYFAEKLKHNSRYIIYYGQKLVKKYQKTSKNEQKAKMLYRAIRESPLQNQIIFT